MLAYQDFVPPFRVVTPEGLFAAQLDRESTFAAAVAAAGAWIREHGIRPLQLETVVLPNLHVRGERGTQDVSIKVDESGDYYTHSRWHQFLRVWYETPEPMPPPYR